MVVNFGGDDATFLVHGDQGVGKLDGPEAHRLVVIGDDPEVAEGTPRTVRVHPVSVDPEKLLVVLDALEDHNAICLLHHVEGRGLVQVLPKGKDLSRHGPGHEPK